ncbi:helix-turn-helix domain-containing protein [Paenibacillus aceti]|uniref:helix-turn-helix domain-containing protein n=1 Tax=Paenibacillus aceti TaxID=1820010 RepID=UPI000EA0DA95|nr:helix-turn-helix transcriptional regulator [Paenibacillus aceti]
MMEDKDINIMIGENVRRLRQLNKMTLRDLEKETGVSQPTLYGIENGRGAKVATLVRICRFFKVSLDQIVPETTIYSRDEDQSSTFSVNDISAADLKYLETILDSNVLPLLEVILPLKTKSDQLEKEKKQQLKNIIYSIVEGADQKNAGSQE